jgi:hypothetical protein
MKITHKEGYVYTKAGNIYGHIISFEGDCHCPKCGWKMAPNQVACIACLPEMPESRKRGRYQKPKPDEGGLFDGDPGINPNCIPMPEELPQ